MVGGSYIMYLQGHKADYLFHKHHQGTLAIDLNEK